MTKTFEEIGEAELQAARQRGLQADVQQARALHVRYDGVLHELCVTLRGGLHLMIPAGLLQGVGDAEPDEISQVELMAGGRALHWEKLDADFSVQDIVAGSFGTRAWMQKLEDAGELDASSIERRRDVDKLLGNSAAQMGRKGGAARTPTKLAASRANGAKGGRPRASKPSTSKPRAVKSTGKVTA